MMILTLGILLAFAGCKEEEEQIPQDPSLYGTWQLIEIFVGPTSSGVVSIKIENGHTYELRRDGTYTTNLCPEGGGTFSISERTIDDKIKTTISIISMGTSGRIPICNENSGDRDGFSVYEFDEQGYLHLTALYVDPETNEVGHTCDEKCGNKFKKIAEPPQIRE